MVRPEVVFGADQFFVEELESAQYLFKIVVYLFLTGLAVSKNSLLVPEYLDEKKVASDKVIK